MNDHLVDIVDINDQIVGTELKSRKAELGYISRVAAVLIADLENNLYICKRAPHKKYSPNLYDLAAVGAVLQGESYQQAAERELLEELGIDCQLEMLDKFYMEAESVSQSAKLRYFCGVFFGRTADTPKLNEELSEIRKISQPDLKQELASNKEKFCPGFLSDYAQVEAKIEQILQ